ncbi:MAG: sigma-54-dependent Fis family transcriptional regulator [Deltaproteobacteria bacterium]|nr:sigma-54-dependent Fis family transcriptional regulator [Deltaproteobacteria bacterium]
MSAVRSVRVLVVEDNAVLRRGIATALRERWPQIEEEDDGARAIDRLRDVSVDPFDVVVTDLRLPGADGTAVLHAARRRDPNTAVLVMTAHGSVESAVEAMKLGAFDFLQKPFDLEQLEVHVVRAAEHARLGREVEELRAERAAGLAPPLIVGSSPALCEALDLARRVAPGRSTVLVTGETGTGKELLAGLIHAGSPRSAQPFVKVNCAALPETLLESELFGHERGAFTGADRLRVGRFEQAHGGTLLLDEVGDLTPATQVRLLRVLQEQEFHRLGGRRSIRTDVRIIAATHQPLEQQLEAGRFREDLYFRLNVIRIHLPPLRERPGDLLSLAEHFLATFTRELGRPGARFTQAARERILGHAWPGNVRELRNAVERALLLSDGTDVDASHFGLPPPDVAAMAPRRAPEAQTLSLEEMQRRLVVEALRSTGHVQRQAAGLLGISPRKLNYLIRKLAITHPSWRRNRSVA